MRTKLLVVVACWLWCAAAGCGGDEAPSSPPGPVAGAQGSAGVTAGQAGLAGQSSVTAGVTGGAAGVGAAGSTAGTTAITNDAGADRDAAIDELPAECNAPAFVAGDSTETITFGSQARSYILHVPPKLDAKTAAAPLVLNFHGYMMTASQEVTLTNMNATADREGFVLAYPEGSGLPEGWNGGDCCGQPAANNIDDVGLARAIVDQIAASMCIDRKRVYATGFSNGGFLSHRIACEAADVFAAVAPVAGMIGIDPSTCTPSRPIPVLHIHGTDDNIVKSAGGTSGAAPGKTFRSVASTIATWVDKNGCTDSAPEQYFKQGSAHCERYTQCNAGVSVALCVIDGQGHCWPGTASCPWGTANVDMQASDEIWKFFANAKLP